ncbi:winged helix-turn-helix domain-containing protein [uncultured Microbacterium sp.]|uniref:ArsR/SmtB family transcription factor n=1 Tax=uncultured Microbacterium sp. TaxID=191216 RepID=UPI0028DD2234|nr:winged helix-turn-helix domain-containing protein [uncultured Microbacterium sp.]
MIVEPGSVSRLGAALSNPARVAMCLALLDGRAWTAGELARTAGVARSTASEHLTTLLEVGLITMRSQGRHAYISLASPDAAHLIEAATAYAGTPAPVTSLHAAAQRDDLAHARTCYDHLAGVLGVALLDALTTGGHLSDSLEVTASGRMLFERVTGAAALEQRGRRPLVRTCLDWTERRPHLSGHLGAELLRASTRNGWVVPRAHTRAVSVTAEGWDAFAALFGVAEVRVPGSRIEPSPAR